MAVKKENLNEEELKETKKTTKKKADEAVAAKKPKKSKKEEAAQPELSEEEQARIIQEKFMEKCRGILAIARKKRMSLIIRRLWIISRIQILKLIRWKRCSSFLKAAI